MSTTRPVVATIHSTRFSPWRRNAPPFADTSLSPGARDLAAVVVFSAIGLVVSLWFALDFPGGLSAFIAPTP